jgi:hypothetical protein
MLQNPQALLFPVLAQVLLTVVVYISLAMAKARAAKAGEVDRGRAALHADAWPESVQKINNNITNQFQVPVLFYVVCFVLLATNTTGALTQVLAWLFVATRVVHAWVHTHSNYVPLRRSSFMVGVVVLVVLWVTAVLRLL